MWYIQLSLNTTYMNPSVSNIIEEDGILRFTLSDVNVSYANALRRIIVADIPTVVFRTFPHAANRASIETNTTRFNNEIIKQRLSCVPIHHVAVDQPIEDLVVEIDVTNSTDAITYITTEDFKVKNIKADKYLPDTEAKKMFPPNALTGTYIDFARLRPKLTQSGSGEALKLNCRLDIGTAREDGAYNVACMCTYGLTKDENKAKEAWAEKRQSLQKEGASKEDIELQEKNWPLLMAKRYTRPDSFDFAIETVGVYNNMELVKLGCAVMQKQLDQFAEMIQQQAADIIGTSATTMPNAYDVKLAGIDYTVGKVIEYYLYATYFASEPLKLGFSALPTGGRTIQYCGFKKPHPHIDESLLRVSFISDGNDKDTLVFMLLKAVEKSKEVFTKMAEQFS